MRKKFNFSNFHVKGFQSLNYINFTAPGIDSYIPNVFWEISAHEEHRKIILIRKRSNFIELKFLKFGFPQRFKIDDYHEDLQFEQFLGEEFTFITFIELPCSYFEFRSFEK